MPKLYKAGRLKHLTIQNRRSDKVTQFNQFTAIFAPSKQKTKQIINLKAPIFKFNSIIVQVEKLEKASKKKQ